MQQFRSDWLTILLIFGFCLLSCFYMSPYWYFFYILKQGDASFMMLHAGGGKNISIQRPCWKQFHVASNYSNNVKHHSSSEAELSTHPMHQSYLLVIFWDMVSLEEILAISPV